MFKQGKINNSKISTRINEDSLKDKPKIKKIYNLISERNRNKIDNLYFDRLRTPQNLNVDISKKWKNKKNIFNDNFIKRIDKLFKSDK